MSAGACERVREALLEGEWAQSHLRECETCRRFSDALAAVDRGLSREAEPQRAPASVLPAVRVAVERERTRRSQRSLVVGSLLSAGAVMAAGLLAASDLGAVAPGLRSLFGGTGDGLAGLAGQLAGTLSALPVATMLYALAAAALVRLLATAR